MKNYKAEIEKIIGDVVIWRKWFLSMNKNPFDADEKHEETINDIKSLIREIVQEATDGMDECGKEILSNVEEALK